MASKSLLEALPDENINIYFCNFQKLVFHLPPEGPSTCSEHQPRELFPWEGILALPAPGLLRDKADPHSFGPVSPVTQRHIF